MARREDFWKPIDTLLQLAIDEDIGAGDVTSRVVLPPETCCEATFIAREDGIMAGGEVVQRLYGKLDPAVRFRQQVPEGNPFEGGTAVAVVDGRAESILTGERIALNILQRMCGVATLTHQFVGAVAGTRARIVDTRKTVPGWRRLDKLAVYLGGGTNHRQGLFDMVLIKDNHVALAARANAVVSAALAVRQAREETNLLIEVEVDTLEQLREVLPEEPDMVLLDNMDPDDLREAVALTGRLCAERGLRKPLLEASGNVTLATARAVAEAGVDRISVGTLTHSCRALDIGLDIASAGAGAEDV
jgi:nicotinate-nucleotide pyrophosphorylase (carboxylating)